MIFTFLFSFLLMCLVMVFSALGLDKVNTLPFGVDNFLTSGMGYIHVLVGYVPPLGVFLSAFLTILYFKVVMFFLRLFRVIK